MAYDLQLYTFHNTEMTDWPLLHTARATGSPTDTLASMVAILLVLCTLLIVIVQAPLNPTTAPRALPLYMQSSLQTLLTTYCNDPGFVHHISALIARALEMKMSLIGPCFGLSFAQYFILQMPAQIHSSSFLAI